MIRYRNTRIKLQKPCIKKETDVRKLSRKDKCYEKDFKIKLMKMSKQIKRNIKTSPKKN